MNFLLPGQRPTLTAWTSREIHPLAARTEVPDPFHDLLEVTMGTEPPGEPLPDGPFARLETSVLAYRVFGPEIGSPVTSSTPVQEGDTIGLSYRFLGGFLRLFFASRVVQVYRRETGDGGWRSGFVYRTLEGHPELGEEVFEVRKDAGGAVSFRLEAWSRPNLWYVKLFTPWARSIQKAAGRSAVANLSQVAAFGRSQI